MFQRAILPPQQTSGPYCVIDARTGCDQEIGDRTPVRPQSGHDAFLRIRAGIEVCEVGIAQERAAALHLDLHAWGQMGNVFAIGGLVGPLPGPRAKVHRHRHGHAVQRQTVDDDASFRGPPGYHGLKEGALLRRAGNGRPVARGALPPRSLEFDEIPAPLRRVVLFLEGSKLDLPQFFQSLAAAAQILQTALADMDVEKAFGIAVIANEEWPLILPCRLAREARMLEKRSQAGRNG